MGHPREPAFREPAHRGPGTDPGCVHVLQYGPSEVCGLREAPGEEQGGSCQGQANTASTDTAAGTPRRSRSKPNELVVIMLPNRVTTVTAENII